MTRKQRLQWIRERLETGPVESQEQLARLVARRGGAGGRVTQATISRDLRTLGVLKGRDGYYLPGAVGRGPGDATELDALLRQHAVAITPAEALVVVNTAPGHANVLASAMDRWPPDEAVGTLAGDDTIFVATSSRAAASRLTGKLLARAGLRRRSRSA